MTLVYEDDVLTITWNAVEKGGFQATAHHSRAEAEAALLEWRNEGKE